MKSLVRSAIFVTFLGALLLPAAAQAQEASVTEPPQSKMGVGARLRYVFMPTAVLDLFLDHSTSMSSVGVGAEIVRRKGNFDIVFGFEYENIEPANGLYLEKGDDPGANCGLTGECPDYVVFNDFALLGFDASFIWHVDIVPKLQFRYGAGIGVGLVLGEVLQYDTLCPPGTTPGDLDNPGHCGQLGTYEEADVPPVVPIVNVLLGFRLKLADALSINLEGGFRDVFFRGAGTEYFF
jgi:hypothetical protein